MTDSHGSFGPRKKLPRFDAQTLMQIAIDEMHKSIAEPRDDGKVSPKVGAVIWFQKTSLTRSLIVENFVKAITANSRCLSESL